MEEQSILKIRRPHAYWKEHILQWEKSGISSSDYCRQQGLGYKSFLGHKRKHVSQLKKNPKPSLHFVEAKVVSEHKVSPASGGVLQLILPNGVRLGVPPDLDLAWLKKVLSVAGALSC